VDDDDHNNASSIEVTKCWRMCYLSGCQGFQLSTLSGCLVNQTNTRLSTKHSLFNSKMLV